MPQGMLHLCPDEVADDEVVKDARDMRPRFSPECAASGPARTRYQACLLYTSDAADDLLCVDLGGRRIIQKKNTNNNNNIPTITLITSHLSTH